MKIIAENEKEKRDILKMSKYLHDFAVYRSRFLGTVEICEYEAAPICGSVDIETYTTLKRGELFCLDMEKPVRNYLRHLYMTPELIEVENEDEKNDSSS